MRAYIIIGLVLFSLTFINGQKLSEEEALEGSGHLMNPDDEDFEASGLPPEDDENNKPSSIKPQFITPGRNEINPEVQSDITSTIVTRRPSSDSDVDTGNNIMIIAAVLVIIGILIILALIICFCRKRKNDNHEYTQGRQSSKTYV